MGSGWCVVTTMGLERLGMALVDTKEPGESAPGLRAEGHPVPLLSRGPQRERQAHQGGPG